MVTAPGKLPVEEAVVVIFGEALSTLEVSFVSPQTPATALLSGSPE